MKKKILGTILLVVVILFCGCQGQFEKKDDESTELNYSVIEGSEFRDINKDGYELLAGDEVILGAIENSIDWFKNTYSLDFNNVDLDKYEGEEKDKFKSLVDGEVVINISALEISHGSKYVKDGEEYVAFNYHVISVMDGGTDIYFAELSRVNNKNITKGYNQEAYGILVLKKDVEGFVFNNSAHVNNDVFMKPHIPEMMFGN